MINEWRYDSSHHEDGGEVSLEKPSIVQPAIPLSVQKNTQVWAVGGGKGGVGKSFVTANLAAQLAFDNKKVIVVDLDLGGANVHTCLGCSMPELSLSDFIQKRVSTLEETCVQTSIPNLKLISGANDSVTIANLKYSQKLKVLSAIKKLDADFIILDLGAGTTFNTLDFYLHADLGILVVLPEPTSIENSYRFIKSAFYRMLNMCDSIPGVKEVIQEAMDHRNDRGIKSPADLLRIIYEMDPGIGKTIGEKMAMFEPNLILNQVRNESDIDIGFSIKTICKKYFNIEMNYVGYLDYDHAVWQSVRRKRVLSLDAPNSPLVGHFQEMVTRLISKERVDKEVRVC